MYLSKLILNPRNVGVLQDLRQPYELHRSLCRGLDCPGKEGKPPGERLLFRLEPERGPGGPVVLVQSSTVPPDWTPLQQNGYLLHAEGPKPFDPMLETGQVLRFRLVANPVVKKKVEGKKHSVRLPLIHIDHTDNQHRFADHRRDYAGYLDWLHLQAERHGFRVLQVQDAPFYTAPRRRGKHRVRPEHYEKHEIPHFGVRFDGVLRVTDAARLVEAVRSGIGPAKAFGFGLLSLRRM